MKQLVVIRAQHAPTRNSGELKYGPTGPVHVRTTSGNPVLYTARTLLPGRLLLGPTILQREKPVYKKLYIYLEKNSAHKKYS
jgi:hypothetical protein